jgi:hypothetical protein
MLLLRLHSTLKWALSEVVILKNPSSAVLDINAVEWASEPGSVVRSHASATYMPFLPHFQGALRSTRRLDDVTRAGKRCRNWKSVDRNLPLFLINSTETKLCDVFLF